MPWHRYATAIGLAAALLFTTGPAVAAPARTISVTGEVADPAGYTATDLAMLGQSTYPVTNPLPGTPRTETGTSLYDLVVHSAPITPAGKNTSLRVIVRVTGRHGQAATFALGELDPEFGDHPAVLVSSPDRRIELIVPGDRNRSRSVSDVSTVRVSVSPAGPANVAAGDVRVVGHNRSVTLPGWLLSRLPSRTVQVTFEAGTSPQTHVETGPPLDSVLLAAGVLPATDTAVVAVGDDGYGAAVTVGEDRVGGRPLLLSTVEDGNPLDRPRLVADGDVKGGRYVSGTVTLAAG